MASARTTEQRLRLFIERVDRSVGRRAIRERTIGAIFTITMSGGTKETSFTSDTGDDEDLRSLLLDFRSFLAPREDVHITRIFNLLEKRLLDEDLRQNVRDLRDHWKAACQGPINLLVDDQSLTAERCFDLRVNGDLFHNDEAEAALYARLPSVMRGLVDQQMASFVIDGLRVLWPTRNVAEYALSKNLIANLDQ